MFDKILVAVDGSQGALDALQVAIEIQQKFDSELLLLCVYRHHSLLEASMSMVRPEEPKSLDTSMEDYASEVIKQAKAQAEQSGAKKLRGFIKAGPPARTIVKFSKDRQANLIVLGSRGLGDIEGYLLGSVSHKVTSLADCPVLVV
ncbi:MAG: universal stress protein [Rhodovibrionaceae bacterium]